jgi:hypothetical protein
VSFSFSEHLHIYILCFFFSWAVNQHFHAFALCI